MATPKLKSTKLKLNVRLLRRVQKHILEEPRRLKMSEIIDKKFNDRQVKNYPPCGTSACIAGWALIISKIRLPYTRQAQLAKAAMLLGITGEGLIKEESESAALFHVQNWPAKFQTYSAEPERSVVFLGDKPISLKVIKKNARIAARRIDYFIKHRA